MRVESLRYFKKLAELESFTEAANELFISQSTLSAAIKRLEGDLGVQLLNRYKSSSVTMTPSGESFYRYATQALNTLDLGIEVAREAAGIMRKTLRVGTIYAMQNEALSRSLDEFRKSVSCDPQIEIEQGFSAVLMDYLKKGDLDVIFASKITDDPELRFTPCCSQRLVVAVNRSHPLSRQKRIELGGLKGRHLVSYHDNVAGKDDVEAFADKAHLDVEWRYESEITLCSMVVSNPNNIALFSYSFLADAFKDVVCIPVEDVPRDFHPIYLISRREEQPKLVDEFIEFMRVYPFPNMTP